MRKNGAICSGSTQILNGGRGSGIHGRISHSPSRRFPYWERLVRGVIREFEENNSGVDLFHFDSDEDVFCVYSQYIDDLMLLSKMIRAACDNEKTMGMYLNMSEATKA